MGLDGRKAHVQRGGELGVRQAPGEEREHLTLALGELPEVPAPFRRSPAGPAEVRDQPPGDARRQQRVAVGDDADGGQQLVQGAALEREAAGTATLWLRLWTYAGRHGSQNSRAGRAGEGS